MRGGLSSEAGDVCAPSTVGVVECTAGHVVNDCRIDAGGLSTQ